MSAKTLKRQLIVAAAMILVGLLTVSSATYAWLALNHDIKADGITVTAESDGLNFEITSTLDSEGNPDFGAGGLITATVNFYDDEHDSIALYPVHPTDLTDNTGAPEAIATWQHALSDTHDDADVDATVDTLANIKCNLANGLMYNDEGDKPVYALVADFYVRMNHDKSQENSILTDIKANNIIVTDKSRDQDNRLINCVYMVVAGPEGAYEIGPTSSLSGETLLIDEDHNVKTESGVLIEKITPTDDPYKLTVFAFFDGQDEDCKSSFFSPDKLSISVDFTGTPGTE